MKLHEAVHLLKSGRATRFYPTNSNFEYGIENKQLFILLDKNKETTKVTLEVDIKNLCENDIDTNWEAR